MGFRDRKVNKVYASPSKGYLDVRTEEGDAYGKYKATPRKLTRGIHEGDTIWELHFPSYEGLLKDVYINRARDNSQYGDQVCFLFEDEEMDSNDRFRRISIQVDMDSGYTKQFIQCCRNINLADPLEVEPYYIARTDKPGSFNSGWQFFQDGERIEKTIKKEDLPKVIEIPRKGGKSDYNRDDLIEFVEAELLKFMKKNKFGEFRPKEGRNEDGTNTRTKAKPDPDEDHEDDVAEEDEEPAPKKAPAGKTPKRAAPDDDDD